MSITAIKGMHDVGPAEIELWHHIEKIARDVFETAGFFELKTPVLEKEILFTQGIGNTTEIVEKEMYRFPDRKEQILALRPEGTASIVRSYIEHYATPGDPYQRFYYYGPMFRYERPQKGRYRQFYQMGAEVFRSAHPMTDAELIHLADQIFRRLDLKNVQLQLNTLGCKQCRPNFREALLGFLRPLVAVLCEDCNRRLERNPLRILDCKKEGCIQATQEAPAGLDYLCDSCVSHFEGVQKGLRLLGTSYQINARMVRGLDYYEKTAFEFLSGDLGAQNAVAGGGRYDGLVKDLGGPDVSGVGFAIGVERLVSLIDAQKVPSKYTTLFLAPMGERAQEKLLSFINPLRRLGYRVMSDYDASTLKALLKQADRQKADYALILGDNELEKNEIQMKPLQGQGEVKQISLDALLVFFEAQIRKPSTL
ncbi:MAG: histidine--tRNA ligase [Deltaproteobacteria bacterium]|nr:histidine--tRNA ligase [Deltaproteobacteria bacterium]